MASIDELLAQLGIGGVARNRAGQVVTNTNDIIPGATAGLTDMLYGAGRGALAGTAAIGGIPGDINQMYVNKFGALFPNEPAAPTSEQISKAVKKAIPPLNLSKGNTGSVATSLGENVVSPMIAPETLLGATNATKIAGKYAAPEVGRMAEQYAIKTGLLSPLDAYHGSPYTFDAFDLSKVGTGEGAQAYGHGIYFAEAPGVARGYQMALGQKAGEITTIGGKPIEQVYEQIYNKANKLPPKQAQIEYDKAAMLEKMMLDTPPNEVISYAKDIGADPAVIKWLETDISPKTKFPGSFYKVDIPDAAVETFLDWDKPLSKQSDNVKKALQNFVDEYGDFYPSLRDALSPLEKDSTTGQTIYNLISGKNQVAGSRDLNSIGIQGIKYLDQGSRMEGNGTRNFVVFDPSIVKMLERNNEPIQGLLK